MFAGDRVLLEEYAKLKSLEKTVELNLAVLEEFSLLLEDNLEELTHYLELVSEDERLFIEKLRGLVSTLIKNIQLLQSLMETTWEDVELSLLKLALYRHIPETEELKIRITEGFQSKLDTLKDFLNIQCAILGHDLEKYRLDGKIPFDVYISFLEKMTEFNRQLWR